MSCPPQISAALSCEAPETCPNSSGTEWQQVWGLQGALCLDVGLVWGPPQKTQGKPAMPQPGTVLPLWGSTSPGVHRECGAGPERAWWLVAGGGSICLDPARGGRSWTFWVTLEDPPHYSSARRWPEPARQPWEDWGMVTPGLAGFLNPLLVSFDPPRECGSSCLG